jgi:hypothetical protein
MTGCFRQRLLILGLAAAVLPAPGPAALAATERFPYHGCFEVASRLHGVPLDLLLAVAAAESNWDPDARSSADAHGIMQIQWPGTARHLGVTRVSELYNPCLNITLGARYLNELIERNGGDEERALAAYNYGPTRIDAESTLPPGAARYVATVSRHRAAIAAGAAGQAETAAAQAAGTEIRFDHPARARKLAELLNRQISSARFTWRRDTDGSYAVAMQPGPEGISLADALRLQDLGWAELGSSP